ncbi:hypothetical protein AB0G02_07805 [Actinosynnema sp. NPDC023658]|uniref:tetratricopeptide repeat protein n=1 Tax=Actinosynnema sp. NPDC023658 TaxID=3155465 RepID=UPI0033C6FC01
MIRNTIADSVVNGPVVQIGSGNVTLALSRPGYALHWVGTASTSWLPPHQRTPSYLLDTRREVVPYRSRPVEERRLEAWLAGDAPMSVLLVHGAGGSGKTRLANAFAGFAHGQGWAVAQATESASGGAVAADGVTRGEAGDGGEPVLVVVDYAERWGVDALLRMIGALPVDFPGRAVRVLLLARSGAAWPALADRLDRLPSELPEPVELGDLVAPADRHRAFADAAEAFARALGRSGGVEAVPDLSAEEYGSALTLHMSALAAAYDGHPGLADLSDHLLRHEGRFWPAESRADAADVVFLATLFGPLDTEAARDLLDRAGVSALLDWHADLYPPAPRTALAPLRPDRFGEDFVARHLRDRPRAVELFDRVPPNRRCLVVLTAAAERHEHVRAVLFDLLDRAPLLVDEADAALLELVVEHASGELCRRLLDHRLVHRLDLADVTMRLAERVAAELPADSGEADRAHVLSVLSLRMHVAGDVANAVEPAREAYRIYESLGERTPSGTTWETAMAATNLGGLLIEAGRLEEAAGPAERAYRLFSDLNRQDPANLLHLVAAIDNLAKLASERGDFDEAVGLGLLAVRALEGSDRPGHRAHLASAHNNLGRDLLQGGAVKAAVSHTREAVALARLDVAEDRAPHVDKLALYVRNLGFALQSDGDEAGALAALTEAVELSRELARMTVARMPEVAFNLARLSVVVAKRDKVRALELVREAIGIQRPPAAFRPDRHLLELADSSVLLALGQVGAGPPSDALPEALEHAFFGVRAYDHLARLGTVRREDYMPTAVAVLADVLDALGRSEEAAAFREGFASATAERPNG